MYRVAAIGILCLCACAGDLAAGGSDGGAGTGGPGGPGDSGNGGGNANNGGGADGGPGPADANDPEAWTPLPPSQIPPPDKSAVVIPNIDSAVIRIDSVAGAKDYRAYVIRDGVEVLVDANEYTQVNGAEVFCAGLRQHGAPALPEPEVMEQIEITGLDGPTEVVIEALDRLCPFTGPLGRTSASFHVSSKDLMDEPELAAVDGYIYTEKQIRDTFGSLILNGQGPAALAGQQALPNVPRVLKRWTVSVAPVSAEEAEARRTSEFFSTFDDAGDQPVNLGLINRGEPARAWQNSEFTFYDSFVEEIEDNYFWIYRDEMRMILPDKSQDVMGALVMMPRKIAHFTEGGYLHVTFETPTNNTGRRYWWLSLCGAEEAGQTIDEDDLLTSNIVLKAGFFNEDGQNPSKAGWNCLLVFPHDSVQTAVPAGSGSNPESSVMVIIHKAGAPYKMSSVNVSPQQTSPVRPAAWYRQMENGNVTTKGVIDDLLFESPRVRFDMYVSRDRVVMYVNGEQRMCNDFGPEPLTMAEAAVGFNDALYHSGAERREMDLSFADRTGQLQYLNNTPFLDLRNWDNVGFEEGVGLPGGFKESNCYEHQ